MTNSIYPRMTLPFHIISGTLSEKTTAKKIPDTDENFLNTNPTSKEFNYAMGGVYEEFGNLPGYTDEIGRPLPLATCRCGGWYGTQKVTEKGDITITETSYRCGNATYKERIKKEYTEKDERVTRVSTTWFGIFNIEAEVRIKKDYEGETCTCIANRFGLFTVESIQTRKFGTDKDEITYDCKVGVTGRSIAIVAVYMFAVILAAFILASTKGK